MLKSIPPPCQGNCQFYITQSCHAQLQVKNIRFEMSLAGITDGTVPMLAAFFAIFAV
jgi:hypothetical protein